MPSNTEIRDALSAAGNKSPTATRDAIERRYAYVLLTGETAADFVPGLTRQIIFEGRVFSRDDADTTTPHDGIVCIVTNGGIRFKVDLLGNGAVTRRFTVLDILAAPPVSPAIDASYLVAVGGTGAWATHDKKLATWTAAGWKFVAPKTYDEAHVADELQIYHYNASSVWVAGIAGIILADNSILFTKLKHGLGQSVESMTTNTPPGSPSEGVAYVVGGSPTGAWAGQAFKIAIYTSGAWLFYTPQIGWKVFDKSNNIDVVYTATGWVSLVTGYSKAQSYVASGSTGVGAGYTYSGTAPTTGNTTLVHSVSYTPKKSGAKIEVEAFIKSIVAGGAPPGTTFNSSFGLFVDAAASGSDWSRGPGGANPSGFTTSLYETCMLRFEYTTTGTSAITLDIRAAWIGGVSSFTTDAISIVVREHA